jgi:hypothetical protein
MDPELEHSEPFYVESTVCKLSLSLIMYMYSTEDIQVAASR